MTRGPDSSVSIATDYGLDGPGIESRWGEIFHRSGRPLGPPSLLYNGYRVFPGDKVWQGRAADHSPLSSVAVLEEYSYTSDRLCGLVVRVSGYRYRGLGFDSRRYQIF